MNCYNDRYKKGIPPNVSLKQLFNGDRYCINLIGRIIEKKVNLNSIKEIKGRK